MGVVGPEVVGAIEDRTVVGRTVTEGLSVEGDGAIGSEVKGTGVMGDNVEGTVKGEGDGGGVAKVMGV